MDGPGDYHTKWSKSDRESQISYDNTYVESFLKKWYKWTYLQNIKRLRKRTYGYQRGRVGGEREIGNLGLTCTHCCISHKMPFHEKQFFFYIRASGIWNKGGWTVSKQLAASTTWGHRAQTASAQQPPWTCGPRARLGRQAGPLEYSSRNAVGDARRL